ncbi:MAG: cysteine desulfurase [Calditrichaeota bacterium]|nr:MAG: cysteine desulfurase [Calditrichota bacterium]
MKRIYLDYGATTPVDPRVVEAMLPYFTETFGNPSSIHAFGREARTALEQARMTLARWLGARESEICFVSGGTEANNLALQGAAHQYRQKGHHIITTPVEHKGVLKTCQMLEKEGFQVTYLPVDEHGRVDPEAVREALRPETILVSIIHGNNEIGTLNPIAEIGRITREAGVLFHTDAVQSFGKVPIQVEKMHIDLLSLSGHKIYGPKGVGALYIRRGIALRPLLHGGSHENNRRAGTENLPGIVGLAKAAELIHKEMDTLARQVGELRDYLREQLVQRFEVRINGHPTERLYNNLNVSFIGCDAHALLLNLDMRGIAVSTGSACSSGTVEPSEVLKALGLSDALATSAIRFTLGRHTTREEIDATVEALEEIVPRLQKERRR